MDTKLKKRIEELKQKEPREYSQQAIVNKLYDIGCNIPQSYLSKLVNGVPRNPKQELKEALAKVLHCDIEDIFDL